jgi:hypothetical protein
MDSNPREKTQEKNEFPDPTTKPTSLDRNILKKVLKNGRKPSFLTHKKNKRREKLGQEKFLARGRNSNWGRSWENTMISVVSKIWLVLDNVC